MKQFTSTQIWEKFTKLNKVEQYEVMSGALNHMQQYNNRTKQCCIFYAMGYEDVDGNGLTYNKNK